MNDAVVVENLTKEFAPSRRGGPTVRAVDGVSFTVRSGESVAIVGESGSGKSTVARMLVGLETPTSGHITIDGHPIAGGRTSLAERRRRARSIQIVFQDPYTSLDPRQSVGGCLAESLRLHDPDAEQRARVTELLREVGLDEAHADAVPSRLSGGQRQRVAIARALACRPTILVLDEAVSALDVSIQGQILNLLADIRTHTGISYIFISHDLAVVRQIAERILVMRRGAIVESGPTDEILDRPAHAYTRLLMASAPRPGWTPHDARALLHELDAGS